MRRLLGYIVPALFLALTPTEASAATIVYNSRLAFEATLGTSILDTYSAAGYKQGDVANGFETDRHSDAHMSAVLGETDYVTTGAANYNIVWRQENDATYCAGCNGSFRLLFTSTSVGSSAGVFGVGLDVAVLNTGYVAFATFGDGTTANYVLPQPGSFFGLTSDLLITSLHMGLLNGGTTQALFLSIDNLEIGSQKVSAVPDSASSLLLLGFGLAGIGVFRSRLERSPR